MTYISFKTFTTKLLTFFSNEMVECNYNINDYTADIYFPEYNIVVEIYDVDEEILRVKEFEQNTNNCMLINVSFNKHHFNSFIETMKIKSFLFNVAKIKSSDDDKLITRLNSKIKLIHDTLLECKKLIA